MSSVSVGFSSSSPSTPTSSTRSTFTNSPMRSPDARCSPSVNSSPSPHAPRTTAINTAERFFSSSIILRVLSLARKRPLAEYWRWPSPLERLYFHRIALRLLGRARSQHTRFPPECPLRVASIVAVELHECRGAIILGHQATHPIERLDFLCERALGLGRSRAFGGHASGFDRGRGPCPFRRGQARRRCPMQRSRLHGLCR